VTLVGANIPFDFGVLANEDPSLLPLIFKAYEEERVVDILVLEALHAIAEGHLFLEEDGTPLMSNGKRTKRYSLSTLVRLVLGRLDAKENDFYRLRYALLENIPQANWPWEAKQYPVDDAENTLEVAVQRVEGGFRNAADLAAQCETDWALHLGAVWGVRTDRERVKQLKAKAEELYASYVKHFATLGFFEKRGSALVELVEEPLLPVLADGTPAVDVNDEAEEIFDPAGYKKNQGAVARAVAAAYGAEGVCSKCEGTGKVRSQKWVECRGEKVRGRFQECLKTEACVCDGTGRVLKYGPISSPVGCKDCSRTGLDLDTCDVLPKTKGGGVSTSRDTLSESGDEELMALSDNKASKILTTYIPYLEKGFDKPINLEPNVLVETGRTSYTGPIQQTPRGGLKGVYTVRECYVARPGRLFGSTDYSAIELCALSQVCLWTVGHSNMADVINSTRDPGSLHTEFAARMIGIPPAEMKARVKAGDKIAKGFRQAAKPCFHPDTEILTRTGWKRIADLTMEDEVANAYLDPGSCAISTEWHRPLTLTMTTTDELFHFESCAGVRVTGYHRMPVWHGERWFVHEAESLQGDLCVKPISIRDDDVIWALSADVSKRPGLQVQIVRRPYNGAVYCLTVPSSFVIARDGGMPIVVGQCNFGFPGGMGAGTFVLTNRKENAGTTEGPDGRKYPGVRFCILVDGARECGIEKVTEWNRIPIPPTCLACLKVVQHQLKPLWFQQWPEVKDYLGFVQREIDATGGEIPCFGPWYLDKNGEAMPHRVRGNVEYCAAANNGFQALNADGAKAALRAVTREIYTDESSILYRSMTRIPFFMHDELFSEANEDLAHLAVQRISEIMVREMKVYMPDVHVVAEPCLMQHWSKDAEPVFAVDCTPRPELGTALIAAGWKGDKDDARPEVEQAGAQVAKGNLRFSNYTQADRFAAEMRARGAEATTPKLVPWFPKEKKS